MSTPARNTPAKLGFEMPAEWHRHSATWLTWPKDPVTWPDRVPQVQQIYIEMMAAITPHETVNLLVDDQATEDAVKQQCQFESAKNIVFHQIVTVDSWIRDYGPNFLIDQKGCLAFNDWLFNAWGDKYEELKKDDQIPSILESYLNVPRFEPGIVMEGGSIEVNGNGCVLTTEQCLLNKNRNPHLSQKEIEQYLKDYLGVTKVLWLGEGIVGDDTDGHIDDIARFVSEDIIVCAIEDDPTDANYELLQDNLKRLKAMTDADGQSFEIVTLPMPGIVGGTSTDTRNLTDYTVTQTFISQIMSYSRQSLVIRTMTVQLKRFKDYSKTVALFRSIANHSCGAWERSTAFRNNNHKCRTTQSDLSNLCSAVAD